MKPLPTLTTPQMLVLTTLVCDTNLECRHIASAWPVAFDELLSMGLVEHNVGQPPQATGRGEFMVKAMRLVPLPIPQSGWVMPEWYGGVHPK
jgi:hypothetical protein